MFVNVRGYCNVTMTRIGLASPEPRTTDEVGLAVLRTLDMA